MRQFEWPIVYVEFQKLLLVQRPKIGRIVEHSREALGRLLLGDARLRNGITYPNPVSASGFRICREPCRNV